MKTNIEKQFDNFGNIAYSDSIDSSTFSVEQRISFTLDNLDWINADGVSKLGLRFLDDVNSDIITSKKFWNKVKLRYYSSLCKIKKLPLECADYIVRFIY